ncbi:putative bifunctional diguanylate cyclase/phosphodiesterase [Marinobacter fonticola]|uniref:putative bifunctional diguanylate cyclase/phosphodiesterase n=1 Tax=Marinobacter fonticola TaxID=2603215 RepID=UPI0011E6AFB8|nr:GGDEF domain-containing phosphodiesterase [Marinobacter fonticola]
MSESEKRLRRDINRIADQLCQAIDGRFDFQVSAETEDMDVQKLSVLANFVLESVRRNIDELEQIKTELEERVADRTRRLDLIIKGSNDGVWEWDPVADCLQVSQRWREMCGRLDSSDALTLDDWVAMIYAPDRAAFRQQLDDHIAGRTDRFRAECRLSDGAGGYRWVVARGICERHPESGKARLVSGTQADITRQKFVNPVTGFFNGRYLELVLGERLTHQPNEPLDLIVVSLTNVALVGETLTANETAALSRDLRRRVQDNVREGELITSLADTTLAILIDDHDAGAIRTRARQLLRAFDSAFSIEDRSIWLSAVVGAIPVRESGLASAESVLQATRMLMRKARQHGGGSFLIYQEEMREENLERLDTEQLLRSALRHGWVESFLQPLVNLQQGLVTGFEALARIRHPDRGLISPALFIPVAEETGLIRELSERILELTIPLFNDPALIENYGERFTLSINLSPVQLYDPRLADDLLRRLSEAGVSPDRLKIELTETAVMADSRVAINLMTQLRERGVAVALDDFGAGYSSLGYIRSLPLDQLKIDRTLVSGVDRDEEKRVILEMIITLCERLDLVVVVEGIENELELSCLLGMGAMVGQGFLFSRPLPVDELVRTVPQRGLLQAANLP